MNRWGETEVSAGSPNTYCTKIDIEEIAPDLVRHSTD